MILNFNNIWCNVLEAEQDEIEAVADSITYTDKKAKYTDAYQSGKWSGKRTLFSRRYKNFPAGLLEYVRKNLEAKKIPYELQDGRPNGPTPYLDDVDCLYDLRYHQKAAVRAFLKQPEGNRGIFQLPTRAGKTIIAGWLMFHLNLPSLMLVPDKRLLHQTREEFQDIFDVECGVLGDSTIEPRLHNVGIIKTVARYLKAPTKRDNRENFLPKAGMVHGLLNRISFMVIDECHRSSADYQIVYRHTPNARYRLGLSATPLMGSKPQKLKTIAINGPILYKQTVAKLANKGLVVSPTVIFLTCTHTPSEDFLTWEEAYNEGIVFNNKRNKMISLAALKMHERGKKVLILVEAIEQGEYLLNYLSNKGYFVDFIYGKHSSDERSNANDRIQNGDLNFLIASRVYNEGIDIPLLDCVIVGGGYKSPILTYQRYGRGMTKKDGKQETVVIDFFDEGSYFLEKHSQERIATANKEKAFKVIRSTIGEL